MPVHRARSGRRASHVTPHRGHVPGRHRRDRPGRCHLHAPRPPLHRGPAVGEPVSTPQDDGVAQRERILLEGEVPSPIDPPSGCRFHPRCRYATEICRVERPPLVPYGNQRLAACHHPLGGLTPTSEGGADLPDREGRMGWDGTRPGTASSASSTPGGAATPVVICHGGPGAAHDYVRADRRAEPQSAAPASSTTSSAAAGATTCATRRPTSGRRSSSRTSSASSRGTSASPTATHVVGQSGAGCSRWTTPSTIRRACARMVVADSPASMPLWVAEANRLRADLPAEVQETLPRHEEAGTTDDPEYEDGGRGLLRAPRLPDRRRGPTASSAASTQIDADPTVYHTMNGPSEFHVVGTLKTWDITDRLREIDDADPARLRPPRRGHAAHRRADPRAHPAARSGSSSRSRATCRTSRSRRARCPRRPASPASASRRSSRTRDLQRRARPSRTGPLRFPTPGRRESRSTMARRSSRRPSE